MDWTFGYVTDLDYTHGYYRELQPDILKLACLSAGIAPPMGDSLSYLELGFGQGLSVNVHAAANPGAFWGTDFNPSQAAHAEALAAAAGTGAKLFDQSFADFARRSDLPQFDIIALHGIWTWISAENRQVIVDLIRHRLRVGGLVYVSYNCFPGWAPAEPLRHLMTLHSDLAGSDAAGTAGKVEGALKFAKDIADSGALYFKQNALVAERLKRITEQNRNYLAHEYFNRDWDLMAFSEVARILGEAKLTFVASAHLLDHIDGVNLTPDGAKLLNGIQHPVLRQSVRDYLVNQQFRRDIFVKGLRRLAPLERLEALQLQPFVLTTQPADVPLKITGALGEGTLQEPIYRPLLEVLAENGHEPKILRRITAHDKAKSVPVPHVIEAMLALTGGGHVTPARTPTSATRAQSKALNQAITMRSRSAADINHFASPVSGGGVAISRLEQLLLMANNQGKTTPAAQAEWTWGILQSQGQRLVKEGKTLEQPQDNIAHLTGMAELFASKRLQILKALEIA
ncbi:MAG: methyltransferase regulatory domain-containing protein [Reyranellaceae bacterium]